METELSFPAVSEAEPWPFCCKFTACETRPLAGNILY